MFVFKGGMSQVTSSCHKFPFVYKLFVEHFYPFDTLITLYFNRVSPLLSCQVINGLYTTIATHYMDYNNNQELK
jgi:hypothetical protein